MSAGDVIGIIFVLIPAAPLISFLVVRAGWLAYFLSKRDAQRKQQHGT